MNANTPSKTSAGGSASEHDDTFKFVRRPAKEQTTKPHKLYVLGLKEGKIYVGTASNFDHRLNEHMHGVGCAWTRLYGVVEVLEERDVVNDKDEMNTTLDYMQRCGIDNVRGGPWTSLQLSTSVRKLITHMLQSIREVCYTCDQKGHCSSDCPSLPATTLTNTNNNNNNSNNKRQPKGEAKAETNCYRCGERGHWASECKSFPVQQKQKESEPLEPPRGRSDVKSSTDNSICYRCHERGHWSINCPKKYQAHKQRETVKCFQCQQAGHYASECSAVRSPQAQKRQKSTSKDPVVALGTQGTQGTATKEKHRNILNRRFDQLWDLLFE